MCEWLIQDEWCDVELFCDGRTFSAHRAVLASVSPFLRHLLVTSTGEDGQIFIILPDFDVDALTSVLYYIYNGEVMIQKPKVKMFFDLIDAMNIFIDRHYTGKLVTKNEPALISTTKITQGTKDVFVLRSENDNKGQNILIKKGQTLQNIKAQFFFEESDNVDFRKCGEHIKPHLASLKPYEDRQRNYFSNDSFIEAYPQNGNCNGLRAAVPAISNVAYRALTSLPLVNTNSKYLDGSLSDASEKTFSKPSHCSINENISNYGDNLYVRRLNLIYENIKNTVTHLELSSEPIVKSKFDLSLTKLSSSFNYNEIRRVIGKEAQLGTRFRTQIIQNKALDSPWSFRIPVDYYKPKKKHMPTSNCFNNTQTNPEFVSSERLDNNNNMKSSPTPVTNVTGDFEAIQKCQQQPNQGITMLASEFKCTVCEQVFQSAGSLSDHKRRHGSPSRFTCSECGKTFSQPRNFKYHMSVHRGTKEYAATCTICGKNFNDRGYLSSHMKIHRNRKEYKCSLCPKSFNQRVAYNMHVRIHTGVKPHICEECGKAFSRKMLLKQHRRTHSGERPHACPRCDRRFADRSNMTLHLRLHTGVKPFSCSMCDKAFTKKHHLKAHINSHTGAKPYSCPRCTLAFTQSSNMRTHYKNCSTQTAVIGKLH